MQSRATDWLAFITADVVYTLGQIIISVQTDRSSSVVAMNYRVQFALEQLIAFALINRMAHAKFIQMKPRAMLSNIHIVETGST